MATTSASTGSSDDALGTALDQLIAEYLAAEEAGLDVSLEDWLRRAGEARADFEAFVRDHEALRRMTQDDPFAAPSAGWPTGPSASWPHLAAPGNDTTAASIRASPQMSFSAELRRNPAGVDFGDYRLLDEVARGGMGVVYRAEHRKLNRIVALKMILSGELAGPEDVERFQKEATAAAQLDHPGIVPVFEVGEQQGRHYFTMPLIEGPSLATRIAAGPLTPRQAAAIALKLAEALAYAHSKEIVHRDLKPANVLLARADGLNAGSGTGSYLGLIGGEPKVTDFGLAKRVSSERGLTVTGQVVGTPSYMSPEQASGRSLEVGPSSDIYSIGAILYEMLTGRPPFRAATPLDTMVQVLESEPIPPRSVNASVDRDLQTICLKCLAKSAPLRYRNATALADDLRRFLEGEPIEAREQNLLSRVTYAIARRRHVEEFSGWGRAITLIGMLVLAAHLVIFTLESWGLPQLYAYWIPPGFRV